MVYKAPSFLDPKNFDINNVNRLLEEGTTKTYKKVGKPSGTSLYSPNQNVMSTAPVYRKVTTPQMSYNAPVIPQANQSYLPNQSFLGSTPPSVASRPIIKPSVVTSASLPVPTNNNALDQTASTKAGVTISDTDPRVAALMAKGMNEDVALGILAQGGGIDASGNIVSNLPATPTPTTAPPGYTGAPADEIDWARLSPEARQALNAQGVYEPTGRPILDANGQPVGGSAIDQYYAGLNTKAPTYEELRDQERKAMQAQIDVINEYYGGEMSRLKQKGLGQLNQTSSIAVGAGLAGSPFQQAQEEKTKQYNTQEEAALRARQSAEVAQAMGLADGRAIQRAQLEMNQANMNRTEYITHLKDLQTDARTSFVNFAKSGKTALKDLSDEQLKKLMADTGLDQLSLESMYNANLPAAQKVDYDYIQTKNDDLIRTGSDGSIKNMGNYSPPDDSGGWVIKDMGKAGMAWVNEAGKKYELISGTAGDGSAPDVKSINGVDSTWDATTGTWKPVTTSQGDNSMAIQTVKDKIVDIDKIINSSGLNTAVGPNPFARFAIVDKFGAKAGVIADVERLISNETMQSLLNLKKAGGTLGALSDGERQMLQAAASNIGTWRNVDKNGKTTGYDIDEGRFKEELNRIKTLAQRAVDQAGIGGTFTNSFGLEGYTEFNPANVTPGNELGFPQEMLRTP